MVNFPNTNLLLAVGGVIAAVFLVNEVRKAGGDLQKALSDIKLPSIGDINFPEIKFPEIKFPEIKFPEIKFPDFFGTDNSSSIAGDTIVQEDGSTITIPADTTIDPNTGIVTSSTPPLLNLSDSAREDALIALEAGRLRAQKELELDKIAASGEDISGAEFASAVNDAEFRRRQEEFRQTELEAQQEILRSAPIVSELPEEQSFEGGGLSFIGGTIRENPIDTLGEVIDLFPELSASQAADFLNEFSGISPTDALKIDPDISNITANIDGENIQVDNVSISDLDAEAARAAETSCRLFGLNCS